MVTEEQKVIVKKSPIVRDAGTSGFFDGAAEGKLMLQYCDTCGKYSLTGGLYCPHCLAKVEWKTASGRGTIHTWSINYQVHNPAFAAEVPYLFAAVDLEEGPQMITRLVDIKPEELRVDLPVSVRFISNDGEETIPAFGPA